jgi:hypothetical protein
MKITQKQAKQDAQALLQKSIGQIVEASHPVFEVLMKHPRAQEKLFTANGKLRHIMVRKDASIIIDGVENFSINKCVFKIADWRDWDNIRRVKNACRTTVKEWIFAWKSKQANLQCFHCQCTLDSQWECDHTIKFCNIVDDWLKTQSQDVLSCSLYETRFGAPLCCAFLRRPSKIDALAYSVACRNVDHGAAGRHSALVTREGGAST